MFSIKECHRGVVWPSWPTYPIPDRKFLVKNSKYELNIVLGIWPHFWQKWAILAMMSKVPVMLPDKNEIIIPNKKQMQSL